jgi:hypothetical protein
MSKNLDLNNLDEFENNEELNEENNDDFLENDEDVDFNNEEYNDDYVESIDDSDFEIFFKNSVNKHKLENTHKLKRDTIFLGKLDNEEDPDEEYEDGDVQPDSDAIEHLTNKNVNVYDSENDLNIDNSYDNEFSIKNTDNYFYKKELSEDIYSILQEKTSINFINNRKKPNKQTFNNYYKMCITELDNKYSRSEIFVELSYYFTDNIFNMFKLLDKKYATNIILELKNKGYLRDIGNISFI